MRLVVAVLLLPLLGPAALAEDFTPNDIFVGTTDGTVREFNPDFQRVRDLSLVTPAVRSPETPRAMEIGPSGRLFVITSDVDSDVLLMIDGSEIVMKAGLDFNLDMQGLAFGPTGLIHVTSAADNVVYTVDRSLPNGTTKDDLGVIGEGSGLSDPRGITFGPDGHMYVASNGTGTVFEFDPNGTLVGEIGANPMTGATAILFGRDGRLYVMSPDDNAVFVFDGAGINTNQIDVNGPSGMSFGSDGNLWVVSTDSGNIQVFDSDRNEIAVHDDSADLAGPIIFSPFRFTLKTSLTVRDTEAAKSTKAKSVAIATMRSGSPSIMIELDELLASLVGEDCLVLRGFETFDVDDPKGARSRLLQAQAFSTVIPDPVADGGSLEESSGGVTSVSVTMKGKIAKGGTFFNIKSAKGTLLFGGTVVASFGSTKARIIKP